MILINKNTKFALIFIEWDRKCPPLPQHPTYRKNIFDVNHYSGLVILWTPNKLTSYHIQWQIHWLIHRLPWLYNWYSSKKNRGQQKKAD